MIAFIIGTMLGMIIDTIVTLLVLEDVDKFKNKAKNRKALNIRVPPES